MRWPDEVVMRGKPGVVPIVALVSLAGCTTLPSSGARGTHYYLGLVRVVFPESTGPLVAADVTTLGLGVDGSAFMGWRDSKFVFARPEDCRVVIIVRDHAEMKSVKTLVQSMEGACITGTGATSSQKPRPSPPPLSPPH